MIFRDNTGILPRITCKHCVHWLNIHKVPKQLVTMWKIHKNVVKRKYISDTSCSTDIYFINEIMHFINQI